MMTSVQRPVKELDEKHIELVGKFMSDIRNGKLQGDLNIALATISFLEQIISESRNATAYELCSTLRLIGQRLCHMLPDEIVAANMVRRVLRAIRDENRAQANQSGEVAGESLQRLVLAAPTRRGTIGPADKDLREPIRDQIAELRMELESTESTISAQARSHIDSDEVVLCLGYCPLVESFLRAAAKGHPYRLIVAEGSRVRESHAMAARLSGAGVAVTVISNVAVFAVMSRVNKMVMSVRAALGGGACVAARGLLAAVSAAKYYTVPVLALTPLYKLVPLHGLDLQFTSLDSPLHTHNYQHCDSAVTHVVTPKNDFLQPDLITLFITNLGGSSPSYIYRLISELYDPKDKELITL